jgi:uncharacterized protein (TIGR02145 family)
MRFFTHFLLVFCLISSANALTAQLPYQWQFTNGPANHIFVVQPSASLQINGSSLDAGDYVGAFYDSTGVLKCAGYMLYTGSMNNITIWADDQQTTSKEGFDIGEPINWRMWDSSESQEYDADSVIFDSSPWLSDGTYFIANGMSGMLSLSASGLANPVTVRHEIWLTSGWSIISTYLQPIEADISAMLAPVVTDVSIVKDWNGQAYWPQYGVNLIGDVLPGHGYQIKMINGDSLSVFGSMIEPDTTQIILPSSWSILGYVRSTPASIVEMISPIVTNVSIIKDWNGQAYWPQYGVNLIGDIEPGQGYLIKMLAQDTLIYPANVVLPVVITDSISNITPYAALGGGEVTYDGGAPILDLGICWNTTGTPTLEDSLTSDGISAIFVSNLYGLAPGSNYFVRAYASNMIGTTFGNEIQFESLPTLPEVSTDTIMNIYQSTATIVADVNYDGGAAITANGVCWNTVGSPTVSDSVTSESPGTGLFESNLSGLSHNTTYFVRAYASNNAGTNYGVEMQFTTLFLPTVITDTITNVNQITATCTSTITDMGGYPITGVGVCWNNTGNPSISDSLTTDSIGTGTYVSQLSGLTPGVIYYLRSYASNMQGVAYGEEVQFTTIASFSCSDQISDYDGNVYNTVQIGTQCWMKENLKTTHYSDGTNLVDGTNITVSYDYNTKYHFDFNDNPVFTQIYGKLYTWAAVMNEASGSINFPSGVNGVCPFGWHMPSNAEWGLLSTYLGGNLVAGGKLKMASPSQWNSPNTGATNSSGFTGLPGGDKLYYNGDYVNLGSTGYFWSTSEYDVDKGWSFFIMHDSQEFDSFQMYKGMGLSVRCLRDVITTQLSLPGVSTDSVTNITDSSAVCYAHVINDGGSGIVERGFCWNTGSNPTTSDFNVSFGSSIGSFSINMTGLTQSVIYYVRAYAINSVGIYYGEELSFTTSGPVFSCGDQIADIDGNLYNTLQIGSQCWMKENLRVSKYSDGTPIPYITDYYGWGNLGDNNTDKGYCYYNNDSALYASSYGALYSWAAAMNGYFGTNNNPSGVQGACPLYWHVPSDNEWKDLEMYLGMSQTEAALNGFRGTNEGGKLKEAGTTHWLSPNTGATNSTGYTALPAGGRSSNYSGGFFGLNTYTAFVTSTHQSTTASWTRTLSKDYSMISRDYSNKSYGTSLRCVKD